MARLFSVQKPSAPLCFNLTSKHLSWIFGSMIATAHASILKNNPSAEEIHLIFDSYLESSLKSGERCLPRVAMITKNTKLPEKWIKFGH